MKTFSRWKILVDDRLIYIDVFQSKKVKSNCSSPWVNLGCILYTQYTLYIRGVL